MAELYVDAAQNWETAGDARFDLSKDYAKVESRSARKIRDEHLRMAADFYREARKDFQKAKRYADAKRVRSKMGRVGEEMGRASRHVAASIAVISLVLSMFFSMTNYTGRVIGNMDNMEISIVGAVFFIIGLIAGLVCVRKCQK